MQIPWLFPDFSQYSFFPWPSPKFPDFSLTFVKSGISLTFPWPLDTLHWSYLRPRVQINMFAFRFVAIGPVLVEIYKNSYLTLKIQGQGHSQGQIWWSHFRPRVQLMCLLFVLWQSDHFWQRYSQFHIWPWKFKVKVMSKVKPDGHIWGLEINRYVCFLFRGNRTIFYWDIAKSIFDLENSRSRSWPRSKPMVTFEA